MLSYMSQSSQIASPADAVREPTRSRGKKRVADLMAAAEVVFLEKGYEAATMTEIAVQAGASIGSLYQFFPTKPLLAEALHVQLLGALLEAIGALANHCSKEAPLEQLVGRLFDELLAFMSERPVFTVLAERRDIEKSRKAATRADLLKRISWSLALAEPPLSVERQGAVALLVVLMMKAAVAVRAEGGDAPEAAAVIAELREMLIQHLTRG